MKLLKGYQFWKWFALNQTSYQHLDEKEYDEVEYLLNELLQQLHEYCDKLVFQIGGRQSDIKELVISAEGNVEYFSIVEELVLMAPRLKAWKFTALAPATELVSAIEYDGLAIDPCQVWFSPIETREEPHLLGVCIYIDGFCDDEAQRYYNAAYVILESVLGERSTALDIHYMEVTLPPNDLDKEDLFLVEALPAYIEMRRSMAVMN